MVEILTAPEGPEVSVYYPESDPPLTDLPVVVFTTGWNQPRIAYASYGAQLAQWGYVAAVRSYPTVGIEGIGDLMYDEHLAHISTILDLLAEENERPESPLFGMADTANAASVGHSQGAGYSLAAPLHDARIQTVVSIDLPPAGTELWELAEILPDSTADTMFISAEWGPAFDLEFLGQPHLIDYVNTPTLEVTVTNATHLDFIDFMIGLFTLGEIIFPRSEADPDVVRAVTTRYTVSWLNVHMKGMAEFETYYNGVESEKDMSDGLVDILYRMDKENSPQP